MKRVNGYLLLLAFLLSVLTSFPLAVSSNADNFEHLYFSSNPDGSDTYYVSGCSPEISGEIIIPSTYEGKPVKYIGNGALNECVNITSVIISDGIEKIDIGAFGMCTQLTSVTLPDSMKEIGYMAFHWCSNLSSINLPDSIESIGYAAFEKTPIYDNEENWEDFALYVSNHLIKVDSKASGTFSIKPGTKTIASEAFKNYCTDITSVIIPSGVVAVGTRAFDGCSNISTLWFPDSLKRIELGAFQNCENLKTIRLGTGIKKLGRSLFGNSNNLENVYIDGLENWCNIELEDSSSNPMAYAKNLYIDGQKLTELIVPEGITEIPQYAFCGNDDIVTIKIPNTVTSIGWGAFAGCNSLAEVSIPESVKSMGINAFNSSNIKSVYITDLTAWCDISFGGKSSNPLTEADQLYVNNRPIENLVIPDGVKSISKFAFYGCHEFDSVVLPDSLEKLGNFAFGNCKQITSIRLPERLRQVGGGAFAYCRKLEDVIITNKWVEIGESSFYDCPALKNVFYAGTKEYWDNLKVDILNQDLLEANIHFESETHIASEWITDTAATVYKSGEKHKDCTVCGIKLETAIIKQLKCSKPELKKISNTEYGVKITWGKIKGADCYRVYRKTSKGKWEYLDSTKNTYFTDKSAKSGTKYYYSVRAKNEAGLSSRSSILSKYYLTDPTLKTLSSTSKGVGIKWTEVIGAEGYVIYRKTDSGSYKKIKTEKGVSNISFRDTSAEKGKKYTYKVKAYYSKTYSAYSNTKTITDKY